jgi:hypothetical protein
MDTDSFVARRNWFLVAFLFVLPSGCGDHHGAPLDAGVDMTANLDSGGSTDDLSSPATDLAGAACNTVSNSAAVVQQVKVNQPMPTPMPGGAAIIPGTYYLTSSQIYQGAPAGVVPLQIKATHVIAGSTIQSVQEIVGSGNAAYTTMTFTTSGTTLTVTTTCGGTGTGMLGYDATSTSYTTYNDAGKTVNVWMKQ